MLLYFFLQWNKYSIINVFANGNNDSHNRLQCVCEIYFQMHLNLHALLTVFDKLLHIYEDE